jgi:hypothetical protein
VIADVRERLSVRKQAAQKCDVTNQLEVREEYQVEISNRFVDLDYVNDSENNKIGLGRTLKRISESELQSV